MPTRRDFALSPLVDDVAEPDRESPLESMLARSGRATPETEMEALMQPGREQTSKREWRELRDVLVDVIESDVLTPQERWVFERTVIERVSLRKLAVDMSLSKSGVAKIGHRARAKVAAALLADPYALGIIEKRMVVHE